MTSRIVRCSYFFIVNVVLVYVYLVAQALGCA
jgi:hypothetical protein